MAGQSTAITLTCMDRCTAHDSQQQKSLRHRQHTYSKITIHICHNFKYFVFALSTPIEYQLDNSWACWLYFISRSQPLKLEAFTSLTNSRFPLLISSGKILSSKHRRHPGVHTSKWSRRFVTVFRSYSKSTLHLIGNTCWNYRSPNVFSSLHWTPLLWSNVNSALVMEHPTTCVTYCLVYLTVNCQIVVGITETNNDWPKLCC